MHGVKRKSDDSLLPDVTKRIKKTEETKQQRTKEQIEQNRQEALRRLQANPTADRWQLISSQLRVWTLLPVVIRQMILRYLRDNIGVIVHWGLYSVPAFDSVASAKHRRIQNGSEWYEQRLTTTLQDSGTQETRRYHNETYGPDFKYSEFKHQFTASKWDPDEWMKIFSRAGASCVVLTAKHHDGFCLWPTATRPYWSSAHCGASADHPDILGDFKRAAKKANLRFGIYYSWMEFNRHFSKLLLETIVTQQIVELIRYKPDLFWFDGDWPCNTPACQKIIHRCLERIRRALPNVEINDRIGDKANRKADPNYLGKATYRVYDDRAIPSSIPTVPWEHVNTIGLSWGRNRQQTERDYKSPQELLQLYRRVTNLNGGFLINVGPNADGTLCETERDRLLAFGRLL
jgi:alpha-L-fucosidase